MQQARPACGTVAVWSRLHLCPVSPGVCVCFCSAWSRPQLEVSTPLPPSRIPRHTCPGPVPHMHLQQQGRGSLGSPHNCTDLRWVCEICLPGTPQQCQGPCVLPWPSTMLSVCVCVGFCDAVISPSLPPCRPHKNKGHEQGLAVGLCREVLVLCCCQSLIHGDSARHNEGGWEGRKEARKSHWVCVPVRGGGRACCAVPCSAWHPLPHRCAGTTTMQWHSMNMSLNYACGCQQAASLVFWVFGSGYKFGRPHVHVSVGRHTPCIREGE